MSEINNFSPLLAKEELPLEVESPTIEPNEDRRLTVSILVKIFALQVSYALVFFLPKQDGDCSTPIIFESHMVGSDKGGGWVF